MLRKGQLRLGSNLFHYGVIIVILGHFVGFLAPHWAVDWALSPVGHQLLAMVVGGIAGLVAIVGLTILLARRLGDPRIRLNSRKWDIAVTLMLWLQLALGLLTVPLSAFHMDGALFETLTSYVKAVVTFNGERSRAHGRSAADLQAAYPARLYPLPDFAIHAHDPYLERRWSARLSVPALSDRAHAADTRQRSRSGHERLSEWRRGDVGPEATNELAAARELLRQRAVAVGLLDAAID